ncbi:AAA family ATPase [Candidatus Thiothrix anitrata]|uniref:AAA family ATPase n=1 Tax=Candidatus Thiothrix anitrata TaxID=2823902 RepID=A0ABX7X042_9GAMM|nr:ATP-binding protein [Candidatus Thiothrix anitrata]QTR49255.1 AAA family ATPase [Candidatus Thiothrix anitrata]
MYIEKIEIKKFRVLENMEGNNALCFQPPGGVTADPETGNVINVIAGVNGCGKTSVLELVFDLQQRFFDFKDSKVEFQYARKDVNLAIEKIPATEDFLFLTEQCKFYFKYPELTSIGESIEDQTSPQYVNIIYFDFDGFSRKNQKRQRPFDNSIERMYKDIEDIVTNYLLSLERTIEEANPALRSKKALEKFNNIFNGVDFYTKLQVVSYENGRMKPEFVNANGEKVNLSDLSDGEQRLYMSAMNLMGNFFQNCIILMDEPEISLHPAWQQKIMQIFSGIGKNNQFIVATHSPQIIASVPYKNRILLRKENGKIQPVHMNQPPSGVDVNSILSEIMGADPRPPELLKLYAQYRKFVEESKENTPEALAVKAQLSEESDHSQFMQEMNFLIELRDA